MEKANIAGIWLAPGSAVFPIAGTGAFELGESEEKTLDITQKLVGGSTTGRGYPSLRMFEVNGKTMQFGATFVKFLLTCFQQNDVTVKAITAGITKATDFTATGGIYTFEDTKSMGINWAMKLSPKERSIAIKCKRSYPDSVGATIITASATDTLPGTLHIPVIDTPNIVKGYILPAFGANVVIADDQLGDWSFDLSTRTEDSALDKPVGTYLDVDIMAEMNGPTPAQINTLFAGGIVPDITYAIGTDTPWNLLLKSGGLTMSGVAHRDDKKNIVTVHLKGSYLSDFADVTGGGITLQAQL